MTITHHAIVRFQERFAPELDYRSAKVRLLILFEQAEELRSPDLWRYVNRRNFWQDCDYKYHREAGIIFAIKLCEDVGPILSTVLPPEKVLKKPKTGGKMMGAKYRGRLDLRFRGGYKRKKFKEEESDD